MAASENSGLDSLLSELGISQQALEAGRESPAIPLAVDLLKLSQRDFILKDVKEYEAFRTKNWAANTHRHPEIILTPRTTDELCKAMKILKFTGMDFAVRGGGHMPVPGAANTDGVLIDMSRFDEVTYDASTETVVAGAGNLWQRVYTELAAHNVTVVGGRVFPVGMGLLLGGGLSYISNRHGTPADNVLSFEVVTSAGEAIDANRQSHADLYWALKGGSSNFGIVTRYTMMAVPMGDVWGGTVSYSIDQAPKVLDALVKYQNGGEDDPDSGICVQVCPAFGLAFANLFYARPVEKPAAFADFYDIPAVANATKIRSWCEFHGETPSAPLSRWSFSTTTLKPDLGAYESINQILVEETAAFKMPESVYVLVLQPISERSIDEGHKKGGNPLGLAPTKQTWVGLTAGWSSESSDAHVQKTHRTMVARVEELAKEAGLHLPFKFLNDGGSEQDIISGYGEENVAKLLAVSAKYDAGKVFQRQAKGGYKLPL